MSHTIKRAVTAVVIAAVVYLISGPVIGYTQYDMYLKGMEFLAAVVAGGCYWIGSGGRDED